MKFHSDYCVVRLPELLKEESKFKGTEGKKLLIDASYHPEKHVCNNGELLSVPNKLSQKVPFAMNAVGPPIYFQMCPDEVIWLDAVQITLKPGDKVYFHHNIIMWAMRGEGMLKEEKKQDGTKEYFLKIRYDLIFCAVRYGKIFPNATWTLVEPDMEDWNDIFHPVPEIDEHGNQKMELKKHWNDELKLFIDMKVPVFKPKEQWIQTKTAPEAKYLKGFIRHIGEPLHGEILDLEVGDHIVYRRHADFEVEIEGKKYFLIKQRHIEAVIK